MSYTSYAICDDCKYVKYSFDGGSTKCGYRGKKDCNFTPRENKGSVKDKERARATDNEITKGMECVIGNDVKCSECTYQKVLPFPSCRMMCAKNALDLINRQKSEIDKLKQENEFCHKTITENAQRALEVTVEAIETAKSEAIKEFAHLVIDRSRNGVIYTSDIPDLVKEMTEVSE